MNRRHGLFGLSVLAGVVGAASLLVTAGAGTAAPVNADAAYGVTADGTTGSVGPVPAVSTTTGARLAKVGSVPAATTNGDFSVATATVTSGRSRATSTVTGFRLDSADVTLDVTTTCRNGRATVVVSGAVNGTYTAESGPVPIGTGTTATFHVAAAQGDSTGAVGAVLEAPGLGNTVRLGYAVCAPAATPAATTTPSPTTTTSPESPAPTTPAPTDTEPPTPSPTTTSLPVTG